LNYTGIEPGTSPDFTESLPPRNVQLYDAKGHPYNPWSRRLGRRLREAMNDVLSVVGVVERSKPNFGLDGMGLDGSNGPLDPTEEDSTGDQLSNAAILDYGIMTSWHSAFIMRLLVPSICSPSDTYTNQPGVSSFTRQLIRRFAQGSLYRSRVQEFFPRWVPKLPTEYCIYSRKLEPNHFLLPRQSCSRHCRFQTWKRTLRPT